MMLRLFVVFVKAVLIWEQLLANYTDFLLSKQEKYTFCSSNLLEKGTSTMQHTHTVRPQRTLPSLEEATYLPSFYQHPCIHDSKAAGRQVENFPPKYPFCPCSNQRVHQEARDALICTLFKSNVFWIDRRWAEKNGCQVLSPLFLISSCFS